MWSKFSDQVGCHIVLIETKLLLLKWIATPQLPRELFLSSQLALLPRSCLCADQLIMPKLYPNYCVDIMYPFSF